MIHIREYAKLSKDKRERTDTRGIMWNVERRGRREVEGKLKEGEWKE